MRPRRCYFGFLAFPRFHPATVQLTDICTTDRSKGRPDGSHGARLSQYPVIAKCDRIMDQDESSESDSTRETVQDGNSRTQRERHPSHAVHVHEENLMMAKEIVIVAILCTKLMG